MIRVLGGVAALVIVAVISLSAATLSVGRQPGSTRWIDQSLFTVIEPASDGVIDTSTVRGTAGPIGDFRTKSSTSQLQRRAPIVATPPRSVVLLPTPRPVHAATGGSRPTAPTATPPPVGSGHRVSGRASWFCLPGTSACTHGYNGGLYAAAGSEIRIGNWRGRFVKVCGNGNCVRVRLIDWCACAGTRIIDLYNDAFRRLASPSVGTIAVTITW